MLKRLLFLLCVTSDGNYKLQFHVIFYINSLKAFKGKTTEEKIRM